MSYFERSYRINSLVVNSAGKLGLYALLNILQDKAWEHAHEIGHGHSQTLTKELFWVLTRQHLQIKKWPMWGDEIIVSSWLRDAGVGSIVRDFHLHTKNKELIGEATTGWLLLDLKSRRPSRVHASEIIDAQNIQNSAVTISPEKITPIGEFVKLTEFEVRNSDLDVNFHVNNTKYAQWVLDAIPFEWHKQFLLHDYKINFLSETHLKDKIKIEKTENITIEGTPYLETFFRGVRQSDQKVAFVVQTKTELK